VILKLTLFTHQGSYTLKFVFKNLKIEVLDTGKSKVEIESLFSSKGTIGVGYDLVSGQSRFYEKCFTFSSVGSIIESEKGNTPN